MSVPTQSSRPARTRRSARTVAAAAAVTVAAGVSVVGLAPAAHATSTDNYLVLAHLNSLRAAHGLRGLTMTGDLASIAASHSLAMERAQTIFHNASLTSQVANWQVLGENVGMGPNAAAIDSAFDNSPEHYANEVNPAYTQVGIGTARDTRGYLYITVDLRKPMYATPAPPATHPVPAHGTIPVYRTVPTQRGAVSAPSTAHQATAPARPASPRTPAGVTAPAGPTRTAAQTAALAAAAQKSAQNAAMMSEVHAMGARWGRDDRVAVGLELARALWG